MKPLQIGLLVVAGAMAGALVMKVWHRPRSVVTLASTASLVETPTPAVEQAPAPASVAAHPVEPAPVASSTTEQPQSRHGSAGGHAAHHGVRPAARPTREHPANRMEAYRPPPLYHVPPAAIPEPVVVARNEPAQTRAQAPVPATPPLVAQAPLKGPTPSPTLPAPTEPEKAIPVPPPSPEPPRVTLNAGMLITVRLVDGLSTERNRPGDMFTATLDKELVVEDFVIAERGARVEGRVVASDPASKTKGVAALAVELTTLHTSDGQIVAIRTESFARNAEPSHRDDAGKVVAGVLLTRGSPVTLPSETRISFRLPESVTLTERVQ